MKQIFISTAILMCACKADFFPLGGYGCEGIAQADSCFLNTILFWGGQRYEKIDSLLNLANKYNIKVILGTAQRPGFPSITEISRGQRVIYQAESNRYLHTVGEKTFDIKASNDTAWVASSFNSGWLQACLWTNEQKQSYADSMRYFVHFILRSTAAGKFGKVCSLLIRQKKNGRIISRASRVLKGTDFKDVDTYETFIVDFVLSKHEADSIDYAIWYMGTGDMLFSDHVVVMDRISHELEQGNFEKDIKAIVQYYNKMPAIFRYYLWDEPKSNQLWASGAVNCLLKNVEEGIGGVQALSRTDIFHAYLDSVRPDELLIDYYPLYGKTNYFGRTPKDSGAVFQKQLDNMCSFIAQARSAAKKYQRHFWYIPQAFGHAITDESYSWNQLWNDSIPFEHEGWWREPTPREMRCMVWLTLAYGAKGIIYYRYQSRSGEFYYPKCNYQEIHWIVGLTNPSGDIKRPLWNSIREINREIDALSHILLQLESDTVFASNNIPKNNFIKEVDDAYIQIGTFHNGSSTYFIIVNRRCLPTDSIATRIKIEYPKEIYLRDCLTDVKIFSSRKSKDIHEFSIQLLPGQGKLYRLERKS